ncbi:hypothetical protein PM082_018016 [Marasmius tenuissimus]|nr:hypothetical protein PM082_018016 [Marasmius tenuissimus]
MRATEHEWGSDDCGLEKEGIRGSLKSSFSSMFLSQKTCRSPAQLLSKQEILTELRLSPPPPDSLLSDTAAHRHIPMSFASWLYLSIQASGSLIAFDNPFPQIPPLFLPLYVVFLILLGTFLFFFHAQSFESFIRLSVCFLVSTIAMYN